MSMTTLETLCSITLFTYFGALSRMILSDLSQSSNSQLLPQFVDSFFLSNILGSFVMGVFVPLDALFSPNYISWYAGVTTGYCGSCTTFSTWQKITAETLVNGWVVDGLMTLFITFCTSYMALLFGKHVGEQIYKQRYVERQSSEGTVTTTTMSDQVVTQNSFSRRSLFIGTFLLTFAIWTGVILEKGTDFRRKWWVATAFGPIGSLLRYWILLRNRNMTTFPLFTFLVNVSASLISTVILAMYVRFSKEDQNDQWLATYDLWLNFGVGAGVLGCFSTVSTFVNELRKLADTNILHAYRYGLLSVLVSQILCISFACTKFL